MTNWITDRRPTVYEVDSARGGVLIVTEVGGYCGTLRADLARARFCSDDSGNESVIAWMQQPEPYQPPSPDTSLETSIERYLSQNDGDENYRNSVLESEDLDLIIAAAKEVEGLREQLAALKRHEGHCGELDDEIVKLDNENSELKKQLAEAKNEASSRETSAKAEESRRLALMKQSTEALNERDEIFRKLTAERDEAKEKAAKWDETEYIRSRFCDVVLGLASKTWEDIWERVRDKFKADKVKNNQEPMQPDPGEGWRFLEPGEEVQIYDESKHPKNDEWIPINNEPHMVRQIPALIYRRRIDHGPQKRGG